jgi:two-component system chemotaxis response regulator CheV
MAEQLKSEILLESGTNEFGIMEFTIGGEHFGINVAKVVEIRQSSPVTPVPHANPYVEGIFKPRDDILIVIDLAKYLGLPPAPEGTKEMFICTRFNQTEAAFHVHTVEDILRISWNHIEKPDETLTHDKGVVTGIAKIDHKLVSIIDFERIMAEINPAKSINLDEVKQFAGRADSSKTILIAEDSKLLERMITDALDASHYKNHIMCSNGQEAWDKLEAFAQFGDDLEKHVACVISDIEMPAMDGHHLLKRIKAHTVLRRLPVILFSSIIDEPMRIKGESLGADAQLSKPEIGNLVTLLDKYLR